ncbi:hypothetical protein [Demequina soli]|nr:hypothetical protein [Demequina soli]
MGARRRRSYVPMAHRNWLVRDHGGMPGWAIIVAVAILVAMLGYAAIHGS